jgi:Ca2+-transporting ATPase
MSQRSGPSAGAPVTGPSLSVTPDGGLSSAEAAARLARYGPNELPRARRTPLWRMIASQLRDPLVIVLLVAAVLTLATGDWTDAGVIVVVIVVNTTAGLTQEVKAGQAIAALSELTAPEARVLRDGEQRTLPATEVVAGDMLVLAEGDIVPADADVTAAAALLVDESALTGESVPADKAAGRHAVSAGTTIGAGILSLQPVRRPCLWKLRAQ